MLTTQAPLPEQAPPQAMKAALAPGVGVSVTEVPVGKMVVQLPAAQLMPPGVVVTAPGPVTFTVSRSPGTKVAVTEALAVMVNWQAARPAQAPVQPVKVLPTSAWAASETTALGRKPTVQVAPQLMPPGVELTVP